MIITLHPGAVSLKQLETIYWAGKPARLDPTFNAGIEKAALRIAEIVAGNAPVYGINTGFGKLASIKIDSADVATLQRNLILSHCCGVGQPLPENVVRLIMALKLVSLGRGASGVRLELVRLIEGMLEKGVIPVIPEKGSVGASGDLAPLAHLAVGVVVAGTAAGVPERVPPVEPLPAGLEVLLDPGDDAVDHVATDRQGLARRRVLDVHLEAAHRVDELLEAVEVDDDELVDVQPDDLLDRAADLLTPRHRSGGVGPGVILRVVLRLDVEVGEHALPRARRSVLGAAGVGHAELAGRVGLAQRAVGGEGCVEQVARQRDESRAAASKIPLACSARCTLFWNVESLPVASSPALSATAAHKASTQSRSLLAKSDSTWLCTSSLMPG